MEVAREVLETSLDASFNDPPNPTAVDPRESRQSQAHATSSSAYTLASDQSVFSRDVDHWIRGSSTESTGVQGNRAIGANLTSNDAAQLTGFWYILALVLPLFSFSHTNQWRCSPSTILNTAEFLLTQVSRMCSQVRCHIQRLATNQVSRELVATAMDAVLVIYAIGFLILSMYQASIIG